MISLSNLLKQCFVMNSEQGMRIIDSNQQAEALLKKHLTEETEQPFVQAVEENVPQEQAEFESGIPAEEIAYIHTANSEAQKRFARKQSPMHRRKRIRLYRVQRKRRRACGRMHRRKSRHCLRSRSGSGMKKAQK